MIRKREAVVLAGGFGTRLAHVVNNVPKPMAPVAERPFLRYILDQLAANCFSRVVIADGYMREQIESYFGNSYRGMEVVYSPENDPLGTGGAVKKALTLCRNEWVFVLNGDTYLDVDFNLFEHAIACSSYQVIATLAAREMRNFSRYGTLTVDTDGTITAFNEKRPCAHGLINAGVYLLRRDALLGFPDVFSLEADCFERVVVDGALTTVVCNGQFIDIGVPEDYARAQTMMAPLAKKWKLALFDRDGTINVDTHHLFEPEKIELIPSTVELLQKYSADPEFKVVVVTNQAGIAKGIYTLDDMYNLHDALDKRLSLLDCRIDAYYYCPHHPDFTGPCGCRKPAPGMLLKAVLDFDADLQECVYYGDKDSDRMAAEACGIAFEYCGEAF